MPRDRRQIFTEYLVLQVQAGRADAFGELHALWRADLAAFARARLDDLHGAEEVAQEAWVGIARGLSRLDDPATFPCWAHRIVARRAADWIRRRQRARHRQRALEAAPEAVLPAGETPSPAAETDAHDEVRAAIGRLPETHREVLHLFYLSEMGVATIAEVLGIPAGTVKSRLFHAREQLRKALTGHPSQSPSTQE